MAQKTIIVSDLSGKEIADSDHARVTIDAKGRRYIVDALFDEVRDLTQAASKKGHRPGRKKAPAS